MKFVKIIFSVIFALTTNFASAAMDDSAAMMFSEIYEKLNSVQWGGKNIGVAIEGLENLSPNAHLAATNDRIVLVWRDSIVGNYQKPRFGDWAEYGKITTALIEKMRDRDARLAAMSDDEIYESAVAALMRGIDESGKYIDRQTVLNNSDNRILTSLGISGWRDVGGEFRVGAVVKGSPADVAGVQVYDLIDKVNGRDVAKMSDAEMDVTSLLGPETSTLIFAPSKTA